MRWKPKEHKTSFYIVWPRQCVRCHHWLSFERVHSRRSATWRFWQIKKKLLTVTCIPCSVLPVLAGESKSNGEYVIDVGKYWQVIPSRKPPTPLFPHVSGDTIRYGSGSVGGPNT